MINNLENSKLPSAFLTENWSLSVVTNRALDKNLDLTPHYDRFYTESPAERPKLLEFIWLKVAV